MKNGKARISAERQRQIEVEGWSPGHDDKHGAEVLENAALSYRDAEGPNALKPSYWPFADVWWKPKDRKRNLERSGALYLAAAATAERARNYAERDRLNDQAQSCGVLLDSITTD